MLGQLKKSSTLLAKIGSVLALIFLYHNIMLLHVDKKLQDSLLELRQVSNKMASNTNINGNSKFPAWNNRTKRHTLSDNDQDRYMSVDLEETSSEPVTSQCMCPPGPPGPQGPPGRRGPRGLQGVKGSRGGPVEIHYPSPNTGKTIHTRSVTTRLQDDLGLAQIVAIKALAGVGATLNPGDVLLLKGEPGSRGERGEPGQPGSPGPVGPPGKDGINGAKGDKGDRGLTTSIEGVPFPTGFVEGPAGPPGPPGLPGPQGRKGDLGERGPPGEKGDKGDRGDRGKRGKRGPKGPIGPMGKSGRKGDKGNPGAPGLDAVACPIGPDGLPVPGCAWKSNSAIAPT